MRTTAEIVADLRTKELPIEKRREAADRLAELEAEVKRLRVRVAEMDGTGLI